MAFPRLRRVDCSSRSHVLRQLQLNDLVLPSNLCVRRRETVLVRWPRVDAPKRHVTFVSIAAQTLSSAGAHIPVDSRREFDKTAKVDAYLTKIPSLASRVSTGVQLFAAFCGHRHPDRSKMCLCGRWGDSEVGHDVAFCPAGRHEQCAKHALKGGKSGGEDAAKRRGEL